MIEIDVQDDLNAVNDQITKMVDELNKLSTAREQLLQQVQNMSGVAMYLRGKLSPEQVKEFEKVAEEENTDENSESNDSISRSIEYP
tara:strand:- start:240 stop:500 length:261 start_codon:yes stop_codon:yes gene_type:complete